MLEESHRFRGSHLLSPARMLSAAQAAGVEAETRGREMKTENYNGIGAHRGKERTSHSGAIIA